MIWFAVALFIVAVFSGTTAMVAGFGIGSLLTPLFASEIGMGPAVAAVALPHAAATTLRCWRLREHIPTDRNAQPSAPPRGRSNTKARMNPALATVFHFGFIADLDAEFPALGHA